MFFQRRGRGAPRLPERLERGDVLFQPAEGIEQAAVGGGIDQRALRLLREEVAIAQPGEGVGLRQPLQLTLMALDLQRPEDDPPEQKQQEERRQARLLRALAFKVLLQQEDLVAALALLGISAPNG